MLDNLAITQIVRTDSLAVNYAFELPKNGLRLPAAAFNKEHNTYENLDILIGSGRRQIENIWHLFLLLRQSRAD